MNALPTVESALRQSSETLSQAGCESPRLDAEISLAECLGVNRAYLLAHGEETLAADVWARFCTWLERRERREPVTYIVGRREFYGLDFTVTPAVLIPRPETEHVVEESLALARMRHPEGEGVAIADVGAGSGAIAVALAVHLPLAKACALEASPDALAVARANADKHGVGERVCLVQCDLLSGLPWRADILVANLPYVTDGEWEDLAPEIRLYEPPMALQGGPDGLDVMRRLLQQAPAHLQPGAAVVLEIGATQGQAVHEMVSEAFPGAAVRVVQDYAGLDRVVVAQLAL